MNSKGWRVSVNSAEKIAYPHGEHWILSLTPYKNYLQTDQNPKYLKPEILKIPEENIRRPFYSWQKQWSHFRDFKQKEQEDPTNGIISDRGFCAIKGKSEEWRNSLQSRRALGYWQLSQKEHQHPARIIYFKSLTRNMRLKMVKWSNRHLLKIWENGWQTYWENVKYLLPLGKWKSKS